MSLFPSFSLDLTLCFVLSAIESSLIDRPQTIAADEKYADANEKALSATPDGEEPTDDESRSLRHVAENLPISAWLVAIVELSERFTYYGMSGLFQNYINRPFDGSQGRGALGMGHQGATGLTTFFQFWCYGRFSSVCTCHLMLTRAVTPIIGAIVADQ